MVENERREESTSEMQHPKEHRGLVARLREMLSNPDNTQEQRAITAETRAVNAEEAAARQALRVRALDALAGESGVAPTDQTIIEAKMQEIAAADAAAEQDKAA